MLVITKAAHSQHAVRAVTLELSGSNAALGRALFPTDASPKPHAPRG